ncbi:MAG TPA: ATP-NAD kinase, partial [Thermoprotei archaeon]|nr:ATP-NAD kinase [Thermoprotei archaeon]
VIGSIGYKTSSIDTKKIALKMLERNIDIIVFVGGDGTARDIVEVVDKKIPILGIPSGVKMYSSIFASTPEDGGIVLKKFYEHRLVREGEILDIDENAFRKDRIDIKMYAYALTPDVGSLIQSSKEVFYSESDEENKKGIAKYIVEMMDKDTIYILGAGTTVKAITDFLGLSKTVLGIDIMHNFSIIKYDVNEREIIDTLKEYPSKKFKIIVSPLGRQGYIFGRGNQQISPKVIRMVGINNIIIIATKQKLKITPYLRVDTGDKRLDRVLKGYRRVVIDYYEEKIVKVI